MINSHRKCPPQSIQQCLWPRLPDLRQKQATKSEETSQRSQNYLKDDVCVVLLCTLSQSYSSHCIVVLQLYCVCTAVLLCLYCSSTLLISIKNVKSTIWPRLKFVQNKIFFFLYLNVAADSFVYFLILQSTCRGPRSN